jgi:ABC-2 type transport system permease protein
MVIALGAFAVLAGGVRLSIGAWAALVVSLVLGVIPFLLVGIAIGNVVNPTGATPIINLSFFVLAFASGIFVPVSQLPDVLQNIAPNSPFYLLGQLAWHAVGVNVGSIATPTWLLALYGVIFLVLAIVAARAEELRSFG